jgi:ribonuclease HI
VSIHPWRLFFDDSTCKEGKGVGVVLVSPKGDASEKLARLEYFCTNNQAEYKANLLGLQILSSMGIIYVEAFGDSLLIMQHVSRDENIVQHVSRDENIVQHVSRDQNIAANNLAQQASSFQSNQGKLYVLQKNGCFGFSNRMFLFSADVQFRNLFY